MTIDDLRAFAAFMSHGSLSRAATHLCLTQPAITRRIQRLETELGGALLDRSVKPPRASALGARFYERAQAVLREADRLREFISGDGVPAGPFRIGSVQSISSTTGVQSVIALKQRFPKLRIEMHSDWSVELVEKVQHGQLDAGAVMLPQGAQFPEGVAAERIGTHRAVVVARANSPLKSPVLLRQLMSYPWVLYPEGGCICRAALLREFQARALKPDIAVCEFGVEHQLALVAAGAGLGFVPEVMLSASRQRRKLRIIRVRDFEFTFVIWLIHAPYPGKLADAIGLFGDVVRSRFGGPGKHQQVQ